MDIESLGAGAGTGFFGAILAYFGFSRRIDKLEDSKQDRKVCDVLHMNIAGNFKDLKEGQAKILDRIDSINEFLRKAR